MSTAWTLYLSSEPSSSGFDAYAAFLRLASMNAPLLTISVPCSTRSLRFVLRPAGFIATSTSGASPGVWISDDEKWSWKPDTPNKLPAGARISAGKSGKVEMSLPASAAALANSEPVSCMPSPESPTNRITTRSRCFVSIDVTSRFHDRIVADLTSVERRTQAFSLASSIRGSENDLDYFARATQYARFSTASPVSRALLARERGPP